MRFLAEKLTIREATAEEILPLRARVLREGHPIEVARFPADQLPDTRHWAAVLEGEIVSIATLQRENHPDHAEPPGWRLRGMATAFEHQGRGYGAEVVKTLIRHLQSQAPVCLWFNARIKAVPFYQKLGFEIDSPLFVIEGIGDHHRMFKLLSA